MRELLHGSALYGAGLALAMTVGGACQADPSRGPKLAPAPNRSTPTRAVGDPPARDERGRDGEETEPGAVSEVSRAVTRRDEPAARAEADLQGDVTRRDEPAPAPRSTAAVPGASRRVGPTSVEPAPTVGDVAVRDVTVGDVTVRDVTGAPASRPAAPRRPDRTRPAVSDVTVSDPSVRGVTVEDPGVRSAGVRDVTVGDPEVGGVTVREP